MARAGNCAECHGNVWLNEDGSCINGHPASGVTGTYEAGPMQTMPAAPSRSHNVLLIVLAIAVGGLFLCGILTAIAVPVFLNASGNAAQKSCFANQRVVVGAAQVYLTGDQGATLPSDWDGLMKVLVPSIIKAEPKCPSGGTYSITPTGNGVTVTCSKHGTFPEEGTAP
jgi:hypothetical protein